MNNLLVSAAAQRLRGYGPDVLTDIVSQITFRDGLAIDEKTKTPIQLLGSTQVRDESLILTGAANDRYSFDVEYFGAEDFTYELMLEQTGAVIGDVFRLPSQWYYGGVAHANNIFVISIRSNGELRTQIQTRYMGPENIWVGSQAGAIKLHTPHHVVVERYNGVIKTFVDGVAVSTLAHSAPLVGPTTGNTISPVYNDIGRAAHRWWNFRLAKRALYQHQVETPVIFPRIP